MAYVRPVAGVSPALPPASWIGLFGSMTADQRFRSSQHLKTNAGKPWAKADLFFLKASAESGMSFAVVAGFLGRDEDEVREKAKELQG